MKAAPSSSAPTSGGTMRLDSPWIAVRTPVAARTTRTGGSLVMGHLAYDRQ